MKKDEKKIFGRHNSLVDLLFNNVGILGIDTTLVRSKCKEYELWEAGRIYVCPDIMIEMKDGAHKIFEVKSSNSSMCLRKGIEQIRKVYEMYDRYGLGYDVQCGLVRPIRNKLRWDPDNLDITYY